MIGEPPAGVAHPLDHEPQRLRLRVEDPRRRLHVVLGVGVARLIHQAPQERHLGRFERLAHREVQPLVPRAEG